MVHAERVMQRQVRTCHPEDGLDVAAREMRDHGCGCLPVVDADERLVGIITDRDVTLAALRLGEPLEKIPVSEGMSSEVFTCGPRTTLHDVQRTMRARRVRRLPVVDAAGRLAGIVSIDDLARAAGLDRGAERSAGEVGRTIAAVTRPRVVVDVERGSPEPSEP